MKAAVDKRDWNKAADEMKDSKWYNQVISKSIISQYLHLCFQSGSRSKELVERMRNIKDK